jgi:hypothetical protein
MFHESPHDAAPEYSMWLCMYDRHVKPMEFRREEGVGHIHHNYFGKPLRSIQIFQQQHQLPLRPSATKVVNKEHDPPRAPVMKRTSLPATPQMTNSPTCGNDVRTPCQRE